MCDNGWDDIFEKEREFMKPLEKGPFYCCKQYCGAYGTLGGVLINHKMEVMTDDYEVIPGLYCVGTDACTIYGDSYNYCIPGNTMGFCLNSGRIAGENAAAALFEDAGDEERSQHQSYSRLRAPTHRVRAGICPTSEALGIALVPGAFLDKSTF